MLCHPKGDKLLALEKLWDNREKVSSTFNHTTGENLLIPEQFKVELSNVYDILEPSEAERAGQACDLITSCVSRKKGAITCCTV